MRSRRGSALQKGDTPPQGAKVPQWMEEFRRFIVVQVGTMMNARLGVIEERLPPERSFRPPLNGKSSGGQGKEAAAIPTPAPLSEAKGGGQRPKKKSGGGAGAGAKAKRPDTGRQPPTTTDPQLSSQSQPRSNPSNNLHEGESWAEVVRKGKGKGARGKGKGQAPPQTPAPPAPSRGADRNARTSAKEGSATKGNKGGTSKGAQPPKTPPRPKLRLPNTAAVVLTPPPEGGVSVAEAMRRARDSIDVRALGIEGDI